MPSAQLSRCASWSVFKPFVTQICRRGIPSLQRHPRPSLQGLCYSSPTRPLAAQASSIASTHTQTSINKEYDHLRQEALAGRYMAVQGIAEKLVKEYGEHPNSRIYEALMLANAECWNGSADEIAGLFRNMADDSVDANSGILHSALQALAIHPDYLLRSYVVRELRHRWLSLTNSGWHDLVIGLIRDRQLEKALEALELMQEASVMPQPWLLDAMLYTLCSLEEFDEALILLEHRLKLGDMSISLTLWTYILDSASRALHYPLTRFVFDSQVRTLYLNPSTGICTNILSTAARQGDIDLGAWVFDLISRRSGNSLQLHHYEALVETYVACENIRGAISLLAIMRAAGYSPTEQSTRTIFTYLSQCRQYPHRAHKIFYSLRDDGRTIPIQAVNVVIEAYIHHHHLSSALELYKSLKVFSASLSPNVDTFNNLLRGCAFHKRKDIAMFLAREMVAMGIVPNALTYDRLLLVCIAADQGLDDAWRYFDEMKAARWGPRGGTTIILVRKACALGDRRVWDLIEDEKGQGLPYDKIKSLVKDFWSDGENTGKTRPHAIVINCAENGSVMDM